MKILCNLVLAFLFLTSGSAQAAQAIVGAYFPLLPYDAPPNMEPSMLPVAANHILEGDHSGVSRAIIVLHDFSRDASKSLKLLSELAGAQNDNTMIVAPQFLLDSDIERFVKTLPEGGRGFARWPLGGWVYGGDSLPLTGSPKGISSFTAIDMLMMYLTDPGTFPDMKDVILIGHGEGGDFVQRYAAAGQAPDMVDAKKISIRYVVANASSYLYLTTVRPQKNRQGFSPPEDGVCKAFNDWPYGVENLNAYAKRAGVNAIKTRFASRSVVYLVAENVGKNDPSPDNDCAAFLQGDNRVTRAMNYAIYTGILYGRDDSRKPNLMMQPSTGYDAAALYASVCGMNLLFGEGDCTGPVKSADSLPPLLGNDPIPPPIRGTDPVPPATQTHAPSVKASDASQPPMPKLMQAGDIMSGPMKSAPTP